MSNKPKLYCEEHGHRHFGVMCRHVCGGEGIRFFGVKLPADHPAVCQVWCRECDSVLQKEGGMTNAAERFFDPRLLCMPCLKRVARRNKQVRFAA